MCSKTQMGAEMTSKIIGTGSYLPSHVVTNDDLAKVVDTDDEWISSRTGIKERRIVDNENEETAYLASMAAKAAIEDAGISPEEIDLILLATMSPDQVLPNVACEVQEAVGAIHAVGMDLNAACSGFVFALNTAHAYITSGIYKNILVIGAETVSKTIDWADRSTCVLFGDGAGAVVVTASESGSYEMVMGADGRKKDALTCKSRPMNNLFLKNSDLEYIKMEGQEVFKFAVKTVPECIIQVMEKAKVTTEDIKFFVLHQANQRILSSVAKRLKVSMDKIPMNVDRYGNTSSASIPILLDELNKKGLLQEGDKLVLSGFGGGLTWGATLIEW